MPVRSKSRVDIAAYHPRFTSPMTFSLGTRTLSRNISLNRWWPVRSVIPRTSTPGSLHVDEEIGDAAVLGGVGVRTGEEVTPVRHVGAAGPYLLPSNHEVVAILHGPSLIGRPGRNPTPAR